MRRDLERRCRGVFELRSDVQQDNRIGRREQEASQIEGDISGSESVGVECVVGRGRPRGARSRPVRRPLRGERDRWSA